MQLGVALCIHANIQPYVAYTFFPKQGTTKPYKNVDEIYESSLLNDFFFTYLVYAFCMVGMLIGLASGKRFLMPNS